MKTTIVNSLLYYSPWIFIELSNSLQSCIDNTPVSDDDLAIKFCVFQTSILFKTSDPKHCSNSCMLSFSWYQPPPILGGRLKISGLKFWGSPKNFRGDLNLRGDLKVKGDLMVFSVKNISIVDHPQSSSELLIRIFSPLNLKSVMCKM